MKIAPRLARYGVTPLLLGCGIGVSFYLCQLVGGFREELGVARTRVDALAAGLLQQGERAEAERKLLHSDMLRHQGWAERRWVELDGRLGRIEGAIGTDDGAGAGAGDGR